MSQSKTDVWNRKQYDKFKKERAQPFLDLLTLYETSAAPRIIDLGCGSGELTQQLHKKLKARQTLGIDSSEAMLEKVLQNNKMKQLQFQKQNIESWSEISKYDLVFSNAALQWCDHHPELFARMKKSLRPKGQLLIQMPSNFDHPTHLVAAELNHEPAWKLRLGDSYQRPHQMLSPEDYASLLHDLGFKKQKVLVKVYPHVLESREQVIEWVRGTLLTYFKSRLSPNDYQSFEAEYKARLFQQLPDKKPFFYPFKRLLIWAR